MKITAGRRDDVLQRKAAYDAEVAEYNKKSQESFARYREAEDAVLSPIKIFLEEELSKFDALNFDVRVDRAYSYKGEMGADVTVECNEHNKFADDSALSWRYRAKLEYDGDTNEAYVAKESSSWSGLKAVTPAQMRSLKQTVEALEFLNSVDWDNIVNVSFPDYEMYRDTTAVRPASQNFDDELRDATIVDLIGTDTWIKVNNYDNSPYNGRYIWIHPLKESGSQFTCEIASDWIISYYQSYTEDPSKFQDDEYGSHKYDAAWVYRICAERRIRKGTIRIAQPEETIDIPQEG